MIIVGVGVCMALIAAIGLLSARRVRGDSTNYLVAGRSLPAAMVATLLVSQAVDSNATLGNADLAAGFGFWAGAALPLGLALCLLLLGLFFARRIRASGAVTLPEFFQRRFGHGTRLAASALTVGSFAILLAGNLVAIGFLFEHFSGLSYATGIWLTIPLAVLYTLFGGMFAGLSTGLAQFALNTVGIAALTIWMATSHGFSVPEGLGPGDLEQLTSTEHGAAINWATLIALGLGNLVAIDLTQRIFSARGPRDARTAALSASAGIVVFCLPLSFVALAAVSVVGDRAADGPILYVLLGDHAPTWLAVLVISGLLAASLTTIGGILLATSSVVVRDVLRVDDGAEVMTPRVLRATRLVMPPIALAATVVALRVPQTGILLTLTFDLLLASLIAPFILGTFWRRGGARAAGAAIVVGIAVRLVCFVFTPTIYGTENTLLHVSNDWLSASIDGWSTFLAAGASLLAYLTVAAFEPAPAPRAEAQPTEEAAPAAADAGLAPAR
ncbi:sodium:solute symporter family transporter [Streptomyces triticirhizae]|uniref:Sodium:solute symporter n=1 Tax=Streptomyces triticirhizae TaxID=2483353 RepID=A0A3M2LM97_9ACTN|nr:sodium:solute symporter [Streptomyces triticirhizae]RMI38584.1 sodium:solute symporter [Streptomyces triticirhizae]